jgi:hypothetical protein
MRRLVLYACLALTSLHSSAARADESPPKERLRAPRALPPHYVLPNEADLKAMHSILPPGSVVATVPVSYRWAEGHIEVAHRAFAILAGNVDGDTRADKEIVLGVYFPSSASPGGTQDDRARIVVFKHTPKGWLWQWTSPGLGYVFDCPRFNIQEVEQGLDEAVVLQPPLRLVKIDGDAHYSIAYFAWSKSSQVGGLPGVYRYSAARWRNVAPQADRFSLRDLNGDGELQVVAGTRFVGYGSGDDDVPRVYRWGRRGFEEASSQFPRFYRELAEAYRKHVRQLEETHQAFARDVWERAIRKAESFATAAVNSRALSQ